MLDFGQGRGWGLDVILCPKAKSCDLVLRIFALKDAKPKFDPGSSDYSSPSPRQIANQPILWACGTQMYIIWETDAGVAQGGGANVIKFDQGVRIPVFAPKKNAISSHCLEYRYLHLRRGSIPRRGLAQKWNVWPWGILVPISTPNQRTIFSHCAEFRFCSF